MYIIKQFSRNDKKALLGALVRVKMSVSREIHRNAGRVHLMPYSSEVEERRRIMGEEEFSCHLHEARVLSKILGHDYEFDGMDRHYLDLPRSALRYIAGRAIDLKKTYTLHSLGAAGAFIGTSAIAIPAAQGNLPFAFMTAAMATASVYLGFSAAKSYRAVSDMKYKLDKRESLSNYQGGITRPWI